MCRRILVVDDDRSLCSLLHALLEDEGYKVDTANDGQSAWEKLAQQPGAYEVVVLDVEMPHMDGLQLLRALRQPDVYHAHQLLVMSASSEALQQAVGMGVSHVLEKPFDLEALLALVATSLA